MRTHYSLISIIFLQRFGTRLLIAEICSRCVGVSSRAAVQLLCEMANIDLQMRTFANTIGEPESESEQEVSENENDDE